MKSKKMAHWIGVCSLLGLIFFPHYGITSQEYEMGRQSRIRLNLGLHVPPIMVKLPRLELPQLIIGANLIKRPNAKPLTIQMPSLPQISFGDSGGGNDYNGGGGGTVGYTQGTGYEGDQYSAGTQMHQKAVKMVKNEPKSESLKQIPAQLSESYAPAPAPFELPPPGALLPPPLPMFFSNGPVRSFSPNAQYAFVPAIYNGDKLSESAYYVVPDSQTSMSVNVPPKRENARPQAPTLSQQSQADSLLEKRPYNTPVQYTERPVGQDSAYPQEKTQSLETYPNKPYTSPLITQKVKSKPEGAPVYNQGPNYELLQSPVDTSFRPDDLNKPPLRVLYNMAPNAITYNEQVLAPEEDLSNAYNAASRNHIQNYQPQLLNKPQPVSSQNQLQPRHRFRQYPMAQNQLIPRLPHQAFSQLLAGPTENSYRSGSL